MNSSERIRWIGVDWGTTSMRLYCFDADDRIIAQSTDGPGMNALDRSTFEPALIGAARGFVPSGPIPPVIMCGMVGSRQGWAEARYLDLPMALENIPSSAVTVACAAPLTDVRILPGLANRVARSADVIRGEETQALGYYSEHKIGDATLCLPGTHCKWLTLKKGAVTASRTFMTGELFALLSSRSILRHSLTSDNFSDTAFSEGVEAGSRDPQGVLSHLFAIRAGDLLFGGDPAERRGYLSGLLIGSEIAVALDEAHRPDMAIIGVSSLAMRYEAAFSQLGHAAPVADGGKMVARGLAEAHRQIHRLESPVPCTITP